MNLGSDDCLNPVLVGGTGRSGSTILGQILGHHPELMLTDPPEIRFLANDHGVAEALTMATGSLRHRLRSKREARLCLERTKTLWFWRAAKIGLHTSITIEELNALGETYLAEFGKDPVAASQKFTFAIMSKVAREAKGRRWVDTTPANARISEQIEPIYPQSQVIAMIRDGRDVAASFVEQNFGPNEIFASLRQWEKRTLLIHQATLASAPGRCIIVDMLDLVDRERDQTLQRICDFLNVPVDSGMKSWFDDTVNAENAHVGRWRTQFDSATTLEIDRVYGEMVEQLRDQGVQIPLVS
ncbi:MAG: sulfotransferase [Actinomycetota bacterium]|nr:sulfotransferase [Actinomycetota bacterium]